MDGDQGDEIMVKTCFTTNLEPSGQETLCVIKFKFIIYNSCFVINMICLSFIIYNISHGVQETLYLIKFDMIYQIWGQSGHFYSSNFLCIIDHRRIDIAGSSFHFHLVKIWPLFDHALIIILPYFDHNFTILSLIIIWPDFYHNFTIAQPAERYIITGSPSEMSSSFFWCLHRKHNQFALPRQKRTNITNTSTNTNFNTNTYTSTNANTNTNTNTNLIPTQIQIPWLCQLYYR